eukprot:gene27185-33871_t
MFKQLAGFSAPVIDYPFPRSDVAAYARTLSAAEGAAPALVDRQTWDDMLLDQYADRLARETSIFGQQELHRRLLGATEGAAVAAAVAASPSAASPAWSAGSTRVRALAEDIIRMLLAECQAGGVEIRT